MQITASSLQAAYQSSVYKKENSTIEQTLMSFNASFSVSEDSAEVSDLAKELADRVRDLDVFSIIFPNSDVRKRTKTLDEVESDFNQNFADFKDLFSTLMGPLGLDSDQAFTMGLDGKGSVKVTNTDNAQAGQVEKVFSDNNVAVSRFAVMAARAALVDAGKTDAEFKSDYENDPVVAIKKHIDGLKERLLGFRLTAKGDDMTYDFERGEQSSVDVSAEISISATAVSAA